MSLPPFDLASAFRLTHGPDEDWKLGDGLRLETELGRKWKEDDKEGWKTMDFKEMEKSLVYKFLISAVVPRPIVLISTLSEDRTRNLATFSLTFELRVTHNPPLVSVCFTLRHIKDTRQNIRANKEFTVNIISEPFVEATNAYSIDPSPNVDEFILSGLMPIPSDIVKPPRVGESTIGLECQLFHSLGLSPSRPELLSRPNPMGTLVLGCIVRAHVRSSILSSDGLTVDTAVLRAVSRLGSARCARVGEGFDLPKPSWKEDSGAVNEVLKKNGNEDGKGEKLDFESGRT